jgi:hypothetical protein
VVVVCKGLLHIFLVQELHILLNLFAILVLPLTVCVICVEVVFIWRDKWRLEPLAKQIVPREVPEPRVIFYILRPIESKSIEWLPLDETVDEVSSLDGPALRDLDPLYLNLLGKDVLSDLPSVSASVGSSSEHALIPNDTHCEVVHGHSVRLFAHHLWSHVTWGSRGVLRVIRVPNSRDSKICDL